MEQTFNDLCRERREARNGLFGFVLWMFVEISAGIIRENITFIVIQHTTRRLIVWAVVVALILLVPLVAMQFTEEVNWDLRGGPRNSDSLLRWDPDPGEGVWYATEETELPC